MSTAPLSKQPLDSIPAGPANVGVGESRHPHPQTRRSKTSAANNVGFHSSPGNYTPTLSFAVMRRHHPFREVRQQSPSIWLGCQDFVLYDFILIYLGHIYKIIQMTGYRSKDVTASRKPSASAVPSTSKPSLSSKHKRKVKAPSHESCR